MGVRNSPRSRFSRSCGETGRRPSTGFTLIELLVAFVIVSIVVGSALSIALSSRNMMTTDEERTRLNQQLRGTLDLLGIDIRQTGERLPGDFPAIEIVDGASGAPDTLILRRNLLDEVLPLCETLVKDEVVTEVRVADGGSTPPQGCAPVADDDSNGTPDNIDAWRAFRTAAGGQMAAYIHNPVEQDGEWFLFDGDGSTEHFLHKGNGDPWQIDHEVDQQCRIYALEERTYRMSGGLLQFVQNTDVGNAVNVSANLIDFQIRAHMVDGTFRDTLDANDEWTDLRAVEITVQARTDNGQDGLTRAVTARFFPRNILSN